MEIIPLTNILAHTHTHTFSRTHTHTHARTHARTHAHKHAYIINKVHDQIEKRTWWKRDEFEFFFVQLTKRFRAARSVAHKAIYILIFLRNKVFFLISAN